MILKTWKARAGVHPRSWRSTAMMSCSRRCKTTRTWVPFRRIPLDRRHLGLFGALDVSDLFSYDDLFTILTTGMDGGLLDPKAAGIGHCLARHRARRPCPQRPARDQCQHGGHCRRRGRRLGRHLCRARPRARHALALLGLGLAGLGLGRPSQSVSATLDAARSPSTWHGLLVCGSIGH